MESLQLIPIDTNNQQLTKIKNLQATTLHRLLGYIPNSIHFKHNKLHTLPYDIVLIDECSMIDISLFAKLMDALQPHTKLILLGDKNQLASIEAGSIFGDICNAKNGINQFTEFQKTQINKYIQSTAINNDGISKSPSIVEDSIVELTKSYRFKDDDIIGLISKAIINNQQETLNNILSNTHSTSFVLDEMYSDNIIEAFVNQLKQYIHEKDTANALKIFNEYKILCATRIGNYGTETINLKIEAYLAQLGLIDRSNILYENKPIMITENHYDLGLFNGDIGIIRKNDEGVLKAWFWNIQTMQIEQHTPSILPKFETVFAMTIHKSQGSEFKHILIVLPDNNSQVLNRELLYTAVTRAKESIMTQAKKENILEICQIAVSRSSGLTQRLQNI